LGGLALLQSADDQPVRLNLDSIAEEANLPVHLHTIGGTLPDLSKLEHKVGRAAFATTISSFQMYMSLPLMAIIFAGVLEHHPGLRMVIGRETSETGNLCAGAPPSGSRDLARQTDAFQPRWWQRQRVGFIR
jgi:hypothetical protein